MVFFLHVVIGLPFPALMAVIAFVITLIPLFGSVIFLIFASIIALFSSPTQALIFSIGYLIYIQLESYVVSPRVMNRAISIPAALVLIGALVGGTLAGVIGVLVALPMMASILLIIREVVVPKQDRKVVPCPAMSGGAAAERGSALSVRSALRGRRVSVASATLDVGVRHRRAVARRRLDRRPRITPHHFRRPRARKTPRSAI